METAIGRHRVRRCAALALSAGLGLLAGLAPVFGEPVDPRDDSVWLRDGRLEIQRLIVVESVRSGAVPAPLALAVAGVESGFVAETLGASGKVGVMQLLPSVAVSEFGADAGNLGDPATGTQQTSADAGTPILFIGNDEDPNALIRSNRMFERVFAGLHRELASQGYDLIDEALAAVDLGRTISDRRSRAEIARTYQDPARKRRCFAGDAGSSVGCHSNLAQNRLDIQPDQGGIRSGNLRSGGKTAIDCLQIPFRLQQRRSTRFPGAAEMWFQLCNGDRGRSCGRCLRGSGPSSGPRAGTAPYSLREGDRRSGRSVGRMIGRAPVTGAGKSPVLPE